MILSHEKPELILDIYLRPAKEIIFNRYLLLSALGLILIMMAGVLIGMELKQSCRVVLTMSNKISRIQSDASLHLANYAISGHVRDLRDFRTVSSPLMVLADAISESERPEADSDRIQEAFLQTGISDGEISRIGRLNGSGWLKYFSSDRLISWDEALNYHSRLLDISRRMLRDHVHGHMTQGLTGDYLKELQELNHEMLRHHELFEEEVVQYEARINRVILWFLSLLSVVGFLFIGYAGFHIEKSWKRREQTLYRSRSRYQEMFEEAGIGLVQINPEGRLLWANPAIARILGYGSVDDLFADMGIFERIFVDSERKSDFRTALNENGLVTNFMFRALRKDEKQIWLLSNARSVLDEQGNMVCYEASCQDYTIYRQTNQELHYLTTILRGTAQSIYQLLSAREFDKAVNELLKIMGVSVAVDRVGVFHNELIHGERSGKLEYEWVKHESLATLYDTSINRIPLNKLDGEREKQFERGEVIQMKVKELEGPVPSVLKKRKSRVIVLAPIYAEKTFWGLIGFENCSNDDEWSDDVLQVMKIISSALGHYVRKTEIRQSLLESKDRYRALVGNIREIVFQTDEEGSIQYVNAAWEKITEYGISETLDRRIHEFIHKDDLEKMQITFRELVNGEKESSKNEYRLMTSKGLVRWLEWTFLVMGDAQSGSRHIYGTMYDLTERKKAEAAMMQNNQRLEALIEGSPMVITATDVNGHLILWNKTAEQIFGWKREEVLGKTAPEVPEHLQQEHFELLDRVSSGQHLRGVELERRRKNGSVIHISMSAAPLYDSDGNVEHIINFSQDITEAKISREAIRKSLKEKDVLLSEIHHRVKNNMAVITGLLSLKAQEQSDPGIAEILKESENRIRSMAMIHEKLYQTETFAEVEFGSYVMELAMHIESNYDEIDAVVNCNVDADEIYLEITQAIPCGLLVNEILCNAYKHAFRGRSKGNITLSFKMNGDDCELYYKDDGVGLPDQVIAGEEVTSLGMNLIRGLSQQLKGNLEISNDNGACYRLLFKLK